MRWRKRTQVYVPGGLDERQKEADDAVVMSTVGYMDSLNQEQTARWVARGHLRIQKENHLGEKMFGVRGRPA